MAVKLSVQSARHGVLNLACGGASSIDLYTRGTDHRAGTASVDRNRVTGLEGYISFSPRPCIGKRLRSSRKTVKWLDKRYPFRRHGFRVEIKRSSRARPWWDA